MATWKELSDDSFEAAKKLVRDGHWRSAVSRAYYAAYAALTADLAGVVTFPKGWNNPRHDDLLTYIDHNLPGLSPEKRRRLKSSIRKLRKARQDSDYSPQRSIDRDLALQSLRDASYVTTSVRIYP